MDDAKLWFIYGAMGSCKTANALMVRFNYQERGMKAALLKPMIECRDGKKKVKSRIGLEADCEFVEDFLKSVEENGAPKIDCIIVDEAQFLSREQVDDLSDMVDVFNIPVMCYGLKTDFQGNAFPGSARLLELADEIIESSTVCWCGRKARFNARVCNGHIVREGEQVQLGGNESYTSLCRKHFKEGLISKPKTSHVLALKKLLNSIIKRFG